MSLSIRIVEYKKGAIRLEPKKLAKFEKAVNQDDDLKLESLVRKYNTPNINIRTQGHCLLGYTILMKAKRCFNLLLQREDIALNMQGIFGCPLEAAVDSGKTWALDGLLAHPNIKLTRCVAASDPNRMQPGVRARLIARFPELPELWERVKRDDGMHGDSRVFAELWN